MVKTSLLYIHNGSESQSQTELVAQSKKRSHTDLTLMDDVDQGSRTKLTKSNNANRLSQSLDWTPIKTPYKYKSNSRPGLNISSNDKITVIEPCAPINGYTKPHSAPNSLNLIHEHHILSSCLPTSNSGQNSYIGDVGRSYKAPKRDNSIPYVAQCSNRPDMYKSSLTSQNEPDKIFSLSIDLRRSSTRIRLIDNLEERRQQLSNPTIPYPLPSLNRNDLIRPNFTPNKIKSYQSVNQFDIHYHMIEKKSRWNLVQSKKGCPLEEECSSSKNLIPSKATLNTKHRIVFDPSSKKLRRALRILRHGQDDQPLVNRLNLILLRKDIKLLLHHQWLNDELINFWTAMIHERSENHHNSRPNSNWPKCHHFNSFFYLLLTRDGYQAVERWTKRIDLFTLDKVIVPVHMGNHWCLAVLNLAEKKIEYYDPLGGSNPKCTHILGEYLKEEWKHHKSAKSFSQEFTLDDWIIVTPSDIPHQQNGYDCGVFTCMYIDYTTRNASFDFRQSDMPSIRKNMLVLMLANKALPIDSVF